MRSAQGVFDLQGAFVEAAEPAGEGDAVIGADAHREAVGAEEPLENGPGLGQLGARETMAGEEHPAAPIGDRERVTVGARGAGRDESESVEVAGHSAARWPGRRRPLALDQAEQLPGAQKG
jgi:hypothetical protein